MFIEEFFNVQRLLRKVYIFVNQHLNHTLSIGWPYLLSFSLVCRMLHPLSTAWKNNHASRPGFQPLELFQAVQILTCHFWQRNSGKLRLAYPAFRLHRDGSEHCTVLLQTTSIVCNHSDIKLGGFLSLLPRYPFC